jgi:hypothetical protein
MVTVTIGGRFLHLDDIPKLKRPRVQHVHDHERTETTTRCTRHETTLMVERPSARSAPRALTPSSTGKLHTHTPTSPPLSCEPPLRRRHPISMHEGGAFPLVSRPYRGTRGRLCSLLLAYPPSLAACAPSIFADRP